MALKKEAPEQEYVKWLFELSNKDVNVAGGKGASLAEMFNLKFPVPPAFIITAQAYEEFVSPVQQEIEKILNETDVENTEQLNKSSEKIRQLIEKQKIPQPMEKEILEAYETLGTRKLDVDGKGREALDILKRAKEPIFVAVRSSATTEDLSTASFAGQQESFLGVKGSSNLLNSIKKCFSSLYTARAIYYREKRGFSHSNVKLAVVIQKMINSDKSGVIFTKNPLIQDENVLIEAVFGLGEGVVSGKINPDQYVVDREIKILNKSVADKKKALVKAPSGETEEIKLTEEKSKTQVLTNSEIERLADLSLAIEKHYKTPQDIEFAIETREIYIVQSRPITTKFKETREIEGKIILQGLAASPGIGIGKVKVIKDLRDLSKIKKGDVLVTEMTNPDMVVTMQKCDAIITDEGGMTSHAAIVSREMGIPAVVGTKKATQLLKNEIIVTVDGSKGKVYEGAIGFEKKKEILPVEKTKIKLKIIIDLPDFAERAAKTGIKQVGLLRLEGIIAESGKHPLMFLAENRIHNYTELLEKGIERIAKYFDSIWIRTSDIRSDEYQNLEGSPKHKETNPMLGFHGITFSLQYPQLLEAEFQAIKKIAEKNPSKKFGIMLPQVISLQQIKEAKKIFQKFKTDNISFGSMIETPAACEIIEDISNEVDFISLGTNDLTQYTLALDRGNENLQGLYNEMHPAVLKQISRVIRICKEKQVETSICGQAGSNPNMVKFLVKQGIDSISVNADTAYEISKLIQQLEKGEEETEEKPVAEEEISEAEEQPINEVKEEKATEEAIEEKPEGKATEEIKEEKAEEFPDVEIGFDVFSPQGEKLAEIKNIDDTTELEEEIEERKEEVEKEKEKKQQEAEQAKESTEIIEEQSEEISEESEEEKTEPEEIESEDEDVLDIF